MKSRMSIAFFTIGVALTMTAAQAGSRTRDQVNLDDSIHYAWGDLGTVRAMPDNTQFIGCYAQSSDDYEWGWCQVMDSAGTYRGCYVDNARHIASIRSIKGDSRISFQWNADTGLCTSITVDNASYYEPKT